MTEPVLPLPARPSIVAPIVWSLVLFVLGVIRTGGDALTSMELGGKSDDDSTEFGCRITVDGAVVAEMTNSGGGEEVTCSAVDGEK